jgi:hypothetical protein
LENTRKAAKLPIHIILHGGTVNNLMSKLEDSDRIPIELTRKVMNTTMFLLAFAFGSTIEELILKGPSPRSSSFWFPRNLFNNMDRQARTHDSVLVKSREMIGCSQTLSWWLGRGKDDRKKYVGPIWLIPSNWR